MRNRRFHASTATVPGFTTDILISRRRPKPGKISGWLFQSGARPAMFRTARCMLPTSQILSCQFVLIATEAIKWTAQMMY